MTPQELRETYGPPSRYNREYQGIRITYIQEEQQWRGVIHYITAQDEYVIQPDGKNSDTLLVIPSTDILSTARDNEYSKMADFYFKQRAEEYRELLQSGELPDWAQPESDRTEHEE
jgi:hypothetical protein